MSKARAGKEVHAIAENKIGILSDISQWFADKAINIKGSFLNKVEISWI